MFIYIFICIFYLLFNLNGKFEINLLNNCIFLLIIRTIILTGCYGSLYIFKTYVLYKLLLDQKKMLYSGYNHYFIVLQLFVTFICDLINTLKFYRL